MTTLAEMHNLFGLAASVGAAAGAGLVSRLTRTPDTAEAHARALSLDPRATRCVLDVLAAFGVASRDGDVYAASPALVTFAEESPTDLDRSNALWGHTPAFLKTGKPFPGLDVQPAQREAVFASVVAGIGRMFAATAAALAARIEHAPDRVLDIGCGSGVWSLAIAERFANARVTGVDLPDVLRAFEARATELGVRGRVDSIAGDMYVVEVPPAAFDVVIIANVLRLEPPDRAERLVSRAAHALAPGGELVLVDAIDDGSPEGARAVSIYALHLAMRAAQGRVHAPAQIKAWLANAGLSDVRDIALPDPLGAAGAISARRA